MNADPFASDPKIVDLDIRLLEVMPSPEHARLVRAYQGSLHAWESTRTVPEREPLSQAETEELMGALHAGCPPGVDSGVRWLLDMRILRVLELRGLR